MEPIVTRSIAGACLALALIIGGWVGSRLTLETGDAVSVALAKRVDPDQAQREALKQEASYEDSETFYQTRIDEAVARHELPAPSLDRLRQPNTFFHVTSKGDPATIEPGATFGRAGLEIEVEVEEIKVEQRGVSKTGQHTLALLRNVGDKPLAYFLRLRSADGDCQGRALTRWDTMALLPDEQAELSICSGEHAVEVVDLRVMEVTELGALWVSKVPPQAVGHDDFVARAHQPGTGIEMCAEIPAVEFAARIEAGEAQWEDIVDYYSRHDCEHFRWWPGYTRIVDPLDSLPVVQPK